MLLGVLIGGIIGVVAVVALEALAVWLLIIKDRVSNRKEEL